MNFIKVKISVTLRLGVLPPLKIYEFHEINEIREVRGLVPPEPKELMNFMKFMKLVNSKASCPFTPKN